MYMHVGRGLNIRILDSLKFLPMKLSSLPKSFALEETKGFFPFHFNTKVNQDYVGPYPDPQFYGAEYMSTEERSKFLDWHGKQKDKTFHFRTDMLVYCRSDVDILRQSCLKFRQLLLEASSNASLALPKMLLTF